MCGSVEGDKKGITSKRPFIVIEWRNLDKKRKQFPNDTNLLN